MKKSFFCFFCIIFVFLNFNAFSQSDKNITLEEKINELVLEIDKTEESAKKIKLYEQLAVCQEFAGLYQEASKSYIACSKIVSNQTEKDSFVLKASRCFLSCGDAEKTDALLTSIASTARVGENAPLLKLYAAWSWLAKCSTFEETHEPTVILNSYLKMDSMKSVKKEILFTLWYITLEEKYITTLQNEFPNSLECAMAQGKVDLSPLPFWYFSPRREVSIKSETKIEPTTEKIEEKIDEKLSLPETKIETKDEPKKEEKLNQEKIYTYQLGFFSSKENAQRLVDRVAEKNIQAQIKEEVRPSGNTYFAVIVKSTDSEIGTIIKNSGFECYPVFE